MDDGAVTALLSMLFAEGWGGQKSEWLDHLYASEVDPELLAGVLLLRAMERIVKNEWGGRARRTDE